MSQLTDAQLNAIEQMTDEVRYQHLLSQVKKQQQLWTLADEQGCLIINTGEERCLVLFPHQQLAQRWAEAEHSSFKPLAIELPVFIDKWLPGMAADQYSVACLPNLAGEGFVESADEFAANFVQD